MKACSSDVYAADTRRQKPTPAKLRTKVKVMTCSSQQSFFGYKIPERTFSHTGGSEDKNGMHRMENL